MLNANANCPSVGLKLLHLGQLHYGAAHVPQALRRQVRAGNVLDEGAEVDTRVLLGVPICCCVDYQSAIFQIKYRVKDIVDLRREWFTPAE